MRRVNFSSLIFIFLTVSSLSSSSMSFLNLDSSSFHTFTNLFSIMSNSFSFCILRPLRWEACFFYRLFISFWCY